MKLVRPSLPDQNGSITLLFCLFSTLIVAAISLSLFLGFQIKNKIRLYNANDAAGLAMASHAAQGLNMIAANNLAIAASIHIAGSFSILSAYLGFAYIFTADGISALEEIKNMAASSAGALGKRQNDYSDKFQEKIWNKLSLLPASFIQAATGLSKFNNFIKRSWLVPTPLYGIEMLRINLPGSIGISFQGGNSLKPFSMSYSGLRQTSPKETFCRSIKASQDLETRDHLSQWLTAPILATFGDEAILGKITHYLAQLERFLDKAAPVKLGFMKCGYGLKSSLSKYYDNLSNLVLAKASSAMSYRLGPLSTDITAVPSISKIMDGIVGSQHHNAPHCRPSWEAYKLASEALRSSESRKSATKRDMLYLTIRDLKKNASFPLAQSKDGSKEEIPAEKMDERCVFGDLISQNTSSQCKEIQKKISSWQKKGCEAFRIFMESPAEENDPDYGTIVADWGQQAETFAKAKGPFAYRKTDLSQAIGFLIPDSSLQNTSFEKSLSFLSLGALPMKFSRDQDLKTCPDELKVTLADHSVFCQDQFSLGMTNLSSITQSEGELKTSAHADTLSAGISRLISPVGSKKIGVQGMLASTWARAIWVYSYSHVAYLPTSGDPSPNLENQLFWPAWQARLGQRGESLLDPLLGN